jgi:hypothetical protein
MTRGSVKRAADRAKGDAWKQEDYQNFIIELAANAPEKVKPLIKSAAPHVALLIVLFYTHVLPLLEKAYDVCTDLYEKAKPIYYQYQLHDILPAVGGLVMCFFGGEFPFLIVAGETFYTTSKKAVYEAVDDLKQQYEKGVEAHKKDEQVDDDHDGTPDVQQISEKEYLQRKVFLAIKVLDPEKCQKACSTIMQSLLIILAAVQVGFVRALALGRAIGDIGKKAVNKYVTPEVEKITPEEYKKWVPFVMENVCTICAVLFAISLQRIISAFHSAVRGGILFTQTMCEVLNSRGYIKFDHTSSNMDEVAGWGLALVGFLFQISIGFSLIFPLNILLMPVTLCEFFLQCLVSIL